MTVAPSHGTVPNVNPSTGNGTGLVTYVNNGDGALSDTFTVLDDSNGSVVFNVTVQPATPTIVVSPSTLSAATVGVANSQSITASGGTAPYTFAQTAGTLPAGMTLSSSGTLSGTPTAGGTFNFTVTATDKNAYTGSRAYTLIVNAPSNIAIAPSAFPSATVAAAYSQNLTASGGTASYTYAISAGALPPGISLSSSGVLSGTPSAGGSFNFTVTATDSSTGSGPYTGSRAYMLTVSAPTITLAPASMPAMTVGASFSQAVTASGGISPYSFAVSAGALPPGLTLAAGGTLSGTPTTAGNYSFTILATDSSTGTGPYTGSQAYSVTVGQAPPTAVNDNASTPANQPVTVNVTGNDSGAITSIAVATLPAHGSATVSGLNVIYTPASNYFGTDSLTYVANGPGGSSSPATLALTVSPLAVPVAVGQSATTLAGRPVTIHAANGASGGPFTAVAIVSAPSSGTAVVSGTDIVYTPPAGSSGTITFSYTLANAFGVSAAATATVSVNPQPVAGAHSATVAAGATVNVDLMAGSSGGPFTAATVVAVSPATAGTTVIRDIVTAGQRAYQLTFTAASSFNGAASISYTLSNAYATSATATITITVTARRDMSTDREVTGLLAAQADSARRFAGVQLSNFTRRLEQLHGDGWASSGMGLSIASPTSTRSENARWSSDDVDRLVGSPLQPYMRKVDWRRQSAMTQADTTANASASESGLPELPDQQRNEKQPLGLWIAGAIDFGQHDVNGQQAGFKFTTNGISMGADYRLSNAATLGGGLGFSRDSADIGTNGSKSSAESVVATAYASVRPARNVFIDGVLGYGNLNFDATRYITDGGGMATGSRRGNQLFGAIASGIEYRGINWLLSPYVRLDMMSATLNPYTETASGTNALTYFKQTVRTTNGTLGLRTEGQYATRIGHFMPRARLEFRHRFDGADEAQLAYADVAAAGPAYTVRTTDRNTGNWSAGIGTGLLLKNGVTLTFDYSSNLNVGNGRSQSLMFGVMGRF